MATKKSTRKKAKTNGEATGIVIEKGVPPPDRPAILATINSMGVGESFKMNIKHWSALRNGASKAQKATKKKFKVHRIKGTDDIGVWRVA